MKLSKLIVVLILIAGIYSVVSYWQGIWPFGSLTYTNDQLGFKVELNNDWEGYRVTEYEDSVDFQLYWDNSNYLDEFPNSDPGWVTVMIIYKGEPELGGFDLGNGFYLTHNTDLPPGIELSYPLQDNFNFSAL